jgi:hypothetical protein
MTANPYESPETPGPPAGGRPRFTLLSLLVVIGIGGLFVACCLLPNVRGSREAGRRFACSNNLRQIALALQDYHDEFGSFPPAYIIDAAGKPLHSWRTLILPFNEQKPLYEKIDLTKPWDDPANREAYETHIPAYGCPSANAPKTHATYLAVVDPGACFNGPVPRKLSDITDDQGRTLLVIEVPADRAVHWMSPSDASEQLILSAVAADQAPHPSGTQAACADASIKVLSTDTPPKRLRALMSIAGDDDAVAEAAD